MNEDIHNVHNKTDHCCQCRKIFDCGAHHRPTVLQLQSCLLATSLSEAIHFL